MMEDGDELEVEENRWLTQSAQAAAEDTLHNSAVDEVIYDTGPPASICVKGDKVICLRDGEWLNEEVINA